MMEKLTSSFKRKRNLTGVRRIVVAAMSIPLFIAGIRNMKSNKATASAQLLSAGYLLFSGISGYSPLRALRDEHKNPSKKKAKDKALKNLV